MKNCAERAAVWLSAVLVLTASHAHAEVTKTNARGQAVMVGTKREAARAAAVRSAQRHALEAVVTRLGGPVEGGDLAVDARLYRQVDSYVKRAAVVGESLDGNILNVEIAAEVDSAAVQSALGSRVESKPSTDLSAGNRVIILATEQLGANRLIAWSDFIWHFVAGGSAHTTVIQEDTSMNALEAAMSESFSNAGFQVIDPQVLKGKLEPKAAYRALDLTTDTAREVASRGDADFVVVVKGVAKDVRTAQLAAGGMSSGQANVVARLVRVKDGQVVASATQHAAQVHLDVETARLNALHEAARSAASELTRKIRTN